MKQIIVFFFIVFTCIQLQAQKTIEKQLQADVISTIKINANKSFRVYIETAPIETISIKTAMEGENSEQLVLLTQVNNDSLFVSTAFQPLFQPTDDKLSAHKVISIVFHLVIPEGLNLNITSDIGSVFLKGTYQDVTTELLNGHFDANEFSGNALVNTIHGDINIETNYVHVDAHTKNGKVYKELLTIGNKRLLLHSINGDITITKTQ